MHFFRLTSQAERGTQVKSNTLTINFSKARDLAGIDWGEGSPATFHEQRSLSERLYKEQGLNTQKLLGHKISSKQTDIRTTEANAGLKFCHNTEYELFNKIHLDKVQSTSHKLRLYKHMRLRIYSHEYSYNVVCANKVKKSKMV